MQCIKTSSVEWKGWQYAGILSVPSAANDMASLAWFCGGLHTVAVES